MLVMHGGAGTITRSSMTPEAEKQYRETLEQALRTGHAILAKGGTSLDAVEASIRVLEDSPLFNAGKGAVFNYVDEFLSPDLDRPALTSGSAEILADVFRISAYRAEHQREAVVVPWAGI